MSQDTATIYAIQTTLSRAIQRDWVRDVDGLLPAIEAALQAAGGAIDVTLSRSDAGERMSKRELPGSCETTLRKIGPNHPASFHLRTILSLLGDADG